MLHVNREDDKYAAVHGLTRALVFNAVQGVTKGWTRELDIVGIGYRAELKGKGTVVFTLGYSHPIEFPLPTGIEVAIDPKQTHLTVSRHRPAEGRPGGGRHALAAQAGSVQEQGRALLRREAEEEGRQDGREVSQRQYSLASQLLIEAELNCELTKLNSTERGRRAAPLIGRRDYDYADQEKRRSGSAFTRASARSLPAPPSGRG